jgi:carbon storage regulator
MLYLTRKAGESVVINDDIEVTVVDIRGRSVKLGFTFPQGASVLRRELYEKIQKENLEAAQTSADFLTSPTEEPAKAPEEAGE